MALSTRRFVAVLILIAGGIGIVVFRQQLAVLAWGRDWPAAEEHLVEAVRLDPAHAASVKYLAALRARRR